MLTGESTPRAGGTLREEPPHSMLRWPGTQFARPTSCILFMLAGFALGNPAPSIAAVEYGWREYDFQSAQGTLLVSDTALASGVITPDNIISFTFSAALTSGPMAGTVEYFNTASGVGSIASAHIPIDNTGTPTGIFYDPSTNDINNIQVVVPSNPVNSTPSSVIVVSLSTNSIPGADGNDEWILHTPAGTIGPNVSYGTGDGKWVWSHIGAPSPVPEPSTAVLAGIGAVCGLAAYGWSRHVQKQRRQRPVGQTDAIE